MTLNYRRSLLNQVLELGGLRLRGCFSGEIEHCLVRTDFSVNVGLVEILALRSAVQRVGLARSHWLDRIVGWSRRRHVQFLGECSALRAQLMVIAFHASREIADGGCGAFRCSTRS